MPCFAAAPGFGYGYMPRHRMRCAPAWASCGPCGFSPCANPLLLVGALFLLPTLIRLFFFGVFAIVGVAFNLFPIIMIACITRSLFNDVERPWCHTKKWSTGDVDGDKKEQHQEENEPAVTVHEDASACVTVNADKINIAVAVPGVRSKDLSVRVIDDHMLRITGETKKGNDVFRVAKDIALPNVNVESMSAKHEDGMLSIVVKRKIHQVNIPIASAVEVTSTPAMNEEDWEPLPAEDAGNKAEAVNAD